MKLDNKCPNIAIYELFWKGRKRKYCTVHTREVSNIISKVVSRQNYSMDVERIKGREKCEGMIDIELKELNI